MPQEDYIPLHHRNMQSTVGHVDQKQRVGVTDIVNHHRSQLSVHHFEHGFCKSVL